MLDKDVGLNNEVFKKLNEDHNKLYRFVLDYHDYIYSSRDYGTGDILSMMEAHVLIDIVDSPGTTVTELAKVWDRTASAISQTVRKLMKKGYVYRENSIQDAKVFFLYPTESAKEFAEAHKKFDTRNILRSMKMLREDFSEEELEIFFSIIDKYSDILKQGTK